MPTSRSIWNNLSCSSLIGPQFDSISVLATVHTQCTLFPTYVHPSLLDFFSLQFAQAWNAILVCSSFTSTSLVHGLCAQEVSRVVKSFILKCSSLDWYTYLHCFNNSFHYESPFFLIHSLPSSADYLSAASIGLVRWYTPCWSIHPSTCVS